MLCDFEWPYEGRDKPRDINHELELARKELDVMTARCCRLSQYIENNLLPLPDQDQKWWKDHKKYDNNKKNKKNASQTNLGNT